MQHNNLYYGLVLEFRPSDPIGVSNTVIELLPRRRREALTSALREIPIPVDRTNDKLLFARKEEALEAGRRLRDVADRVSLQLVQRRDDIETESVYGLQGWLCQSGHQYIPVSGREAL